MKANELIIGRYYSASAEFKGSIEAKLNYNGEQRVFLLTKENLILILQLDLEKWVNPIPLTEEWLEKLGFKKNQQRVGTAGAECVPFDYTVDGWHRSDIVIKDFQLAYPIFNVELQYVHQLQNLYFALTGEELTIKLYDTIAIR